MDFRLKLYWNENGDAENAITLTTQKLPDAAAADGLLESFRVAWGKSLTGAALEQHVPGIGWVNADDAETAVICHNRMLADRENVEEFLDRLYDDGIMGGSN